MLTGDDPKNRIVCGFNMVTMGITTSNSGVVVGRSNREDMIIHRENK